MKTNGMVGNVALALAIGLCASLATANDFEPIGEPAVTAASPLDSPYEETSVVASVPASFWYGGAEVVFMGVNAQSGGTITASFSDTTAPGVATTAFLDGRGVADLGFASRFWFGRQFGENWGLRTSFFSVQADESRLPKLNPAIPTTGVNFGTFTASGTAEFMSVDLDLVRSFNWSDDVKLDVFGGARYARFDVASKLYSFGVFTTGNFINLDLENDCQFDGVGPTLGFSSRTRMGSSSLFLVWSGRGSMLFGNADMFARSSGTVASSPSAPLVGAASPLDANRPSSLGILETQLGVQYEWEWLELPFNYFVKFAFEGQYWNINNKGGVGAGFGGTIGELTTNSFASAGPSRASMAGLSLSTGFTW